MSAFRVVLPRSIPFAEANRVQRESWRLGYSTRLAGRDAQRPGSQVVEFLRSLDELPDPAVVTAFADDLDAFLERRDANSTLPAGHERLWIEQVQRHLPHGD